MTSIPIYLAVVRFGADGEPGIVTVTGTGEKAAALGVTAVPLPAGISRWEARKAVAAVLHDHGWRVAGMWDDRSGDVAWAVAVERVVTCTNCRAEIWWRIPARLADRPAVLGAWCDHNLSDICHPAGGRTHEPRRTEGE